MISINSRTSQNITLMQATPLSSSPAGTDAVNNIVRSFSPQSLIILLSCAAIMGLFAFLDGKGGVKSGSTKKNTKGRAKWAGTKELLTARKLAVKQLNGRSRKSACVWIIRPKNLEYPDAVVKHLKLKNGKSRKLAPEIGAVPDKTPVKLNGEAHRWKDSEGQKTAKTIWLPDTQRSVMVLGAPGSGKTFSAIDPMIRSIIEQGFPLLLYDFKYPTQTSTVAWYAEKMGYDIHVFAPGFPESDTVNLLDFLTGDVQDDASLAKQLATVLNKNFRIGQVGAGDPFFDSAGDQLTQAVMMLAKQMPLADIITVSVILSMPQLIERLYPEGSGLDPWIRQAFGQLFSVKDSEKTVSSILGTAAINFGKLMMPKMLAATVGKTTLPLDIEGKQMIVFGMDRELRDVVGPIIASVIHMIVNRNLFRKGGRRDPLFTVLDELPTIFLPQLVNWENESRSDGFNGIIGFQNKSQLKKIYGEDMALAIMGGCATKFIFNPGEVESSEYFSRFFGDEEIARRTKSRSKNAGKGGNSTSTALEVGTRRLVAPEEFLCLQPGEAIFTNPQYSGNDGAYIPRRMKFNLPPSELALAELIEQNWGKVHKKLVERSQSIVPTKEDILLRTKQFTEQFPVPDDKGGKQAPDPISVLAGMF
jgi:type IV secretory pathway TraG/TraD family ATPase VirD4